MVVKTPLDCRRREESLSSGAEFICAVMGVCTSVILLQYWFYHSHSRRSIKMRANLVFLWCLWHLSIELHVVNMENNECPLCQTKAQKGRWFLLCNHLLLWAQWSACPAHWAHQSWSFLLSQPGWVKFNPHIVWSLTESSVEKKRGRGKRSRKNNHLTPIHLTKGHLLCQSSRYCDYCGID